jgi:hypothetical protein
MDETRRQSREDPAGGRGAHLKIGERQAKGREQNREADHPPSANPASPDG